MAKAKFDIAKISLSVVAAGAGGVGTELALNKLLPSMNPMVRSLLQIGLGGAAVAFGSKSEMLADAGKGAIGAGGVNLAKAVMPALFGATVAGIGAEDSITVDTDFSVEGIDEADAVAAIDQESTTY